VTGTGSGSCPIVSCGISRVELLGTIMTASVCVLLCYLVVITINLNHPDLTIYIHHTFVMHLG